MSIEPTGKRSRMSYAQTESNVNFKDMTLGEIGSMLNGIPQGDKLTADELLPLRDRINELATVATSSKESVREWANLAKVARRAITGDLEKDYIVGPIVDCARQILQRAKETSCKGFYYPESPADGVGQLYIPEDITRNLALQRVGDTLYTFNKYLQLNPNSIVNLCKDELDVFCETELGVSFTELLQRPSRDEKLMVEAKLIEIIGNRFSPSVKTDAKPSRNEIEELLRCVEYKFENEMKTSYVTFIRQVIPNMGMRISPSVNIADTSVILGFMRNLRNPEKSHFLQRVTGLEIGSPDVQYLPPEIGLFTNLRDLDLLDCRFTSLPNEIGSLVNLTHLRIEGTELTALPSSIGDLTKLETLKLDGNPLTQLPPSIGNLTNLKELELPRNQLTQLPPEIGNLTNLLLLDISSNSLSDLPDEFSRLQALELLDLENNRFETLPSCICELRNLVCMSLFNNLIENLPDNFRDLNLHKLVIGWNPIAEYFNRHRDLLPHLSPLNWDGVPYEDEDPENRGVGVVLEFPRDEPLVELLHFPDWLKTMNRESLSFLSFEDQPYWDLSHQRI
ncbi:MAG: hypothetical protein S4CHLAM37_13830 [Chlamydiia bacterium]|nr:hypothetical protein [Chlamydiia bacterium]